MERKKEGDRKGKDSYTLMRRKFTLSKNKPLSKGKKSVGGGSGLYVGLQLASWKIASFLQWKIPESLSQSCR